MKTCIIIGGADISNYKKLKRYFDEDDFFIYCDGGLKHLKKLEKNPNLIIGDFDSHENPNLPIETIVLPCEKMIQIQYML
jgi:thiamine pyrophosphokinase